MKEKGYTFVEILVTIFIISILFTIGYAGYRDFSRRQALSGVAKKVQGDLRWTQQMSLSGIKPSSCGTNVLDGIRFGVAVESGVTLYRIRAVCGGSTPLIRQYDFPSNITVDSFTPNPIVFKVLGRGTNITGGNVQIVIRQTETNNTATITVEPGGSIK